MDIDRAILIVDDKDNLQTLKEAGALDSFMRKPWDGERLGSECRRLLEES